MARDPKAEVEISAHSRGLAAKLREARAKFGRWGSELRKNALGKDYEKHGLFGSGKAGFWGMAGASLAGNVGARALGAIGGVLADQGKAVFDFEDRLNRLQIATGKTPEEMRTFADSIRAASNETGVSAEKILAGAQAYVALTGDMDGAIAKQREFAQIAQATGSEVSDIAGAAAALKQNLKVVDSDTIAAFSALAVQGKEGAIELKDLAAQLSTIAPQWAQFGRGTGMQGLKELGSTLQIVKRGFGGDAGETVTGLASLLTSLQKNAGNFQKAKIKIFDKDPQTGAKTMRNVLDIVDSISNSALVKDPTKLAKAFGRTEAYRAFLQISQNRDALNDLIAKSSDAGVIQADLQKRLESTAGRTQVAWEKAKNKLAEVFTPERIELFANALVTVVELAGKLVGFIDKIDGAVDKLTGGDKKERKAAAEHAKVMAMRAATMSPEEKFRYGNTLLQTASDMYGQIDKADPKKAAYLSAHSDELRKLGFKLRDEGDPWLAHSRGGGAADADSGLSEEQKARSRAHMMKLGIEGLKRDITDAIREGFKVQGQPINMNVDGKNVATAARNSSRAGARPGG